MSCVCYNSRFVYGRQTRQLLKVIILHPYEKEMFWRKREISFDVDRIVKPKQTIWIFLMLSCTIFHKKIKSSSINFIKSTISKASLRTIKF